MDSLYLKKLWTETDFKTTPDIENLTKDLKCDYHKFSATKVDDLLSKTYDFINLSYTTPSQINLSKLKNLYLYLSD
uniref:Uncharacterized protein n=1 Tax=viral metagenome TaxID=1070528 RepID=A0A6C0AEC9_9ZZZZ